jgi:hypothetical protein
VVSALAAGGAPPGAPGRGRGGGGDPAGGQGRVEGGRVDQATVVQHYPGLTAEEGRIGDNGHILESGGLTVPAVEKSIAPLALLENHLEELLDVVGVEVAVGEPGAIAFQQVDEDLSLAVASAADFHHGDRQGVRFEVGLGLGDEV